jgi:Sec7-like guanine-nucleotide exchange factor
MTALSNNTSVFNTSTTQSLFVPFTAFMEINFPNGYGNRWERISEIEKVANNAENDIFEYISSHNYTIDIARPIKYTVSFGDFKARLTINGNIKESRSNVPKIVNEEVTVINTGKGVTGYGCYHVANKVTDAKIYSIADNLISVLNGTISNATVTSIEVAGVKFGKKGTTLTSI